MQEWINQTLGSPGISLTVLAAVLLFGLVGAVSSSCNLAVIGAIVGYSGTLNGKGKRRDILLGGLFFMVGTIIALAVLGAVAGFISQTVGASVGGYWKFFAGLIMVVFGLASLNFIPFRLPKFTSSGRVMPTGAGKAMVFGLVAGGGSTACSVGCNPVLPIALGAATLQGNTVWGAAILTAFAVGYSLPLAAGLIGLSFGFGRLTSGARRFVPGIKIASGVLLIGVGFYLLVAA